AQAGRRNHGAHRRRVGQQARTAALVSRVAFIVNPNAASGKGLGRWNKLSAALTKHDIFHQAVLTERVGHARELATQLAFTNELIVAVGGDGTVHEVANGILESSPGCALGVFPVGTGNDFATAWGFKQNVEQHLSLLNQPLFFKQDVLKIENGLVKRWCISVADIGLAADVAKRINESNKSVRKSSHSVRVVVQIEINHR
ncbi:MAG TPA: acylglycerol kinase family protein, partial [Chitinophagales bacterium]|nr:acylglycerol kinase family protein [Chitinophagales bacterium]